jgi:quercetin 2,3-dioxygenase
MLEIHRSNTRGVSQNKWLNSQHSFSYADYYNPKRTGVGKLRVLNDDVVSAGKGCSKRLQVNMEIVSIPLSGSLHHTDSIGNQQVVTAGDVQVMSAGKGITHSEHNHSTDEPLNFLEIWIVPRETDTPPRYAQKTFSTNNIKNRFFPMVSPRVNDEKTLWINQDAFVSFSKLDKDTTTQYPCYFTNSDCYFFVIEGEIKINDETIYSRDGFTLSENELINITAIQNATVICVETNNVN